MPHPPGRVDGLWGSGSELSQGSRRGPLPVRASKTHPPPISPTGLPGGSQHRGKNGESSPQINVQGASSRMSPS